jgi:hypothetical protein
LLLLTARCSLFAVLWHWHWQIPNSSCTVYKVDSNTKMPFLGVADVVFCLVLVCVFQIAGVCMYIYNNNTRHLHCTVDVIRYRE